MKTSIILKVHLNLRTSATTPAHFYIMLAKMKALQLKSTVLWIICQVK